MGVRVFTMMLKLELGAVVGLPADKPSKPPVWGSPPTCVSSFAAAVGLHPRRRRHKHCPCLNPIKFVIDFFNQFSSVMPHKRSCSSESLEDLEGCLPDPRLGSQR
uniref:Uncharacterized protein n=1 Tax=Oryza meridionalis TaxID=40149 RepID=A0A0E0FE85_9ORYZ